MNDCTRSSTGDFGTPVTSRSLESLLLDSGKKKRKASPLASQMDMEREERSSFETLKTSFGRIVNMVAKLDGNKVALKKLKDVVMMAETHLKDYAEMRLARNNGPTPAVVFKPATKDADTDMDLTPEWWVPTQPVPLNGKALSGQKPKKDAPKSYAEAAIQSLPSAATETGDGPFTVVEKRRKIARQPLKAPPDGKAPAAETHGSVNEGPFWRLIRGHGQGRDKPRGTGCWYRGHSNDQRGASAARGQRRQRDGRSGKTEECSRGQSRDTNRRSSQAG